MNYSLIIVEITAVLIGLGVLMTDLWISPAARKGLGYAAAVAVGCLLAFATGSLAPQHGLGFRDSFVVDDLARFFKAFFLFGAIVVILMTVEFSSRIASGLSEFFALVIFALVGMLFAASANDLVLLFVSLELITVTFYILTSFQRNRLASLEAGVKYLILGAVASAFMVFGIALIFGSANSTNFRVIAAHQTELATSPVFLLGLLLVLAGLGFKIAAFPFQAWAPDVYQGSPAPATAFLAVGSKAAGFVLLIRLLTQAVPQITAEWSRLLVVMSAATIIYGSLCAIPQRNLKRLMGYSSIANAGYLLLGIVAMSRSGSTAILFYLGGYFFTVLAAFTAMSALAEHIETDEIAGLAGLGRRSPFLAATLTLSLVSLAGIPPMVGFFGKVLLLRSVFESAPGRPDLYLLLGIAVIGVVISLYYYFGVIRSIYWGGSTPNLAPIRTSLGTKFALGTCIAGMVFLGIAPNGYLRIAETAIGGIDSASGRLKSPALKKVSAHEAH
jgi:NADH-quinone oxidoreductase subunit N